MSYIPDLNEIQINTWDDDEKENEWKEQLKLFEDFLDYIRRQEDTISSDDMAAVIGCLDETKSSLEKKEEERLRIRRRQEEEQRKKEEKERAEAHIKEVTSMDLPLDWENVFDTDVRTQSLHVDSISDGLILSLSNLGKVDIEYISSITGEDYKSIIGALKGSIYQNPDEWGECFFKGWETAEEYLSGNLHRKWKTAVAANKDYNGYFEENVKALEKLIPPALSEDDIYITLGSPWVPVWVIDDFVNYIVGNSYIQYSGTKHDELTGTWEIPNKGYFSTLVSTTSTYGTEKISAMHIIERTLNMKTVSVTEEVSCKTNKSGKKRVVNRAETVLALDKQKKIIQTFQDWVWRDENRKKELIQIFETNFNCVRRRIFDGAFLEFPTLSENVTLYPYQKNAVARILFSPNTLLAHDVGSGKTYIMIVAGMELKRMGLSSKNLYVVPNNIVGQWKSIYKQLYPTANILCVEPKSFRPSKRKDVLEKIRDEDFDGIIMAYSCFEQIPLSNDYYIDQLQELLEQLESYKSNVRKNTGSIRSKEKKIKEKLSELTVTIRKLEGSVYFDELGITRLFVDEAHNFKNVPIETKVDKVLGISASGSKRCQDMMDKVHLVQKNNDGGGVVMATGTPITNSITDAFVMQKYLQSGELALLDLQSFDSWIGMFAEKITEFEVDVDTSSYRMATRFSKFHNLPELTSILASVADFHQMDETFGVPDFDGYIDVLIGKTPEFADYLKDISHRAEMVRKGYVRRNEDNMLNITTDGRKAALDLRLVDDKAGFTYQSKVARCVETVVAIYHKTQAENSAQLIFCDSSTPKAGFNIYDEVKRLLMEMEIPQEQIAYIHEADSEKKRKKLFEKVCSGELRILIGSTFKLGLGVNVQDKLIALHHLDIPWRPADMVQREGRILRQGNENKKIYIYRYITEGSFDAYSWQLLETKQRFIVDLLSGSMTERSGKDIEDTILDYAEVKALAVGNALVKERVETANELSRYQMLQRKLIETRLNLEQELAQIPGQIQYRQTNIANSENDYAFYQKNRKEYDKDERKAIRSKLFEAVNQNVLEVKERTLMTYQGFTIILPANMQKEKPYIWLKRDGKYYVELGETEVGNLVRIDNFLDHFPSHTEKQKQKLEELGIRRKEIKAELLKEESYADVIAEYKQKLAKLDKKLGVKL